MKYNTIESLVFFGLFLIRCSSKTSKFELLKTKIVQ